MTKDIDIEELTQVISDAIYDWYREDTNVGNALPSRFIAQRVLAHLTDGDK